MSALPEDVQLHRRNLLERHQRAVERVDAVLATPDQQHPLAQLVHLAPHHAELEVGPRERLSHRRGRGQRLGLAGDLEPLVDQLGRDELLVVDHDAQELLDVLARRLAANLPSSLTPSVGSGANRLTDSPPGPISTRRPARFGLSSANRTAVPPPSELPTSAARSMPQMVEQVQQRGRAVAVVLLVFGVLVGVAVARLVDGEHMEVLGQHGDVASEVRPARRTGAAAVQQHDRLLVTDAGLVIVQPHVLADLRIAGGRLERDLLLLCGFGGERRHQTIVSWGGSPNSLLPKIR